jgi:beta-glucanase (GH16 family)
MKTYTLPVILSISLLGLLGCKKIDAIDNNKPAPEPINNINPQVSTPVCDYSFNETELTSTGWTKAFEDDFTGDLTKWYAYTGGVKGEAQYYKPENAQIVNGVLEMSAKIQSVTAPSAENPSVQQTYNFTSASIVTNQTFSANATTPKVRIVARVKIASGYGLVSVFESYGLNWPTNGQINFFQVEGNNVKQYETNYFYGTEVGKNLVNNSYYKNPVTQDLSTCWHVFTTEWTQNSLKYYLDGQLVETKTSDGYVPALFGKAQNLSLLMPIGGLYYFNFVPANVQAGTMYVDYVKVFTSK